MARRNAQRWMAALLLPALVAIPAVLSMQPAQAKLVQTVAGGHGQIDWTSGQIKVTGSGTPPGRGTYASKRLMAERAAIVDAYRQLGEIVQGVHVDAETTVREFIVDSDVIQTRMQAFIQGARRVGNPRQLSDGTIEVDMVLNLYGRGNLADIIQPQKPLSKPTYSTLDGQPTDEAYTGVIIDLQGRGAQPAMSPSILDSSGGELYLGQQNLSEAFIDFVINEGIVAYANSMGEARQLGRAGKNPLILKAAKATGKFKADAVLDDDAAQKLLGADAKAKLFAGAKVVFVL